MKKNQKCHLIGVALTALLIQLPSMGAAPPKNTLGSAALSSSIDKSTTELRCSVLHNDYHCNVVRIGVYGQYDFNNNEVVFQIDDQILAARSKGIVRVLINFNWKQSSGKPIGTYDQWFDTGNEYAQRYRPNSSWLKSKGIYNWGVQYYAAFNEFDVYNFSRAEYGPQYHDALEGLADGVHQASSGLKVLPGGFQQPDKSFSWNLNEWGPYLVDLWNDGKLDGIDLHVYATGDGNGGQLPNRNWAESAQRLFDRVKSELGITRDINFYCTEFNVRDTSSSEDHLAKRFFTQLWDRLSVVKENGDAATEIALAYHCFDEGSGEQFHLATDLDPVQLKQRGQTMKLVSDLAASAVLISDGHYGSGIHIFEAGGRKLWVWQNLNGWTNQYSTSITITGIPSSVSKIKVYDYKHKIKSVSTNGNSSVTITGLNKDETYVFLGLK